MIRSALGKVAWVGRTASMVFGLALVLALVFGVASMAFGANGQNFILGKLNNAASKVTGLVGNVDGAAALRVTNPNAGTNDTALDLRVQADEAPMAVNSVKKVTNLNADRIDDREASSFANAAHHHAGEDVTSGTVAEGRIDGSLSRDSEVMPTVKANDGADSGLDADTVDGKDSTELRGARAYARVFAIDGTGSYSFDPNLTSGFTDMSRSPSGIYCLTPANGISPQNLPAVVSVDRSATVSPQGNAVAMVGTNDLCPGDQFQVNTERQIIAGNGTLTSTSAANVSFTIIVP